MSTLQIKQIEHQLSTGQKTFSDKTIRVLLDEIRRLREQAAQLPVPYRF